MAWETLLTRTHVRLERDSARGWLIRVATREALRLARDQQRQRPAIFDDEYALGQPLREGVPLRLSACSPAGVLDDRGDVAAARAPVNLSRVARERGRCHADLVANVPSELRRRVAELGGNEAQ